MDVALYCEYASLLSSHVAWASIRKLGMVFQQSVWRPMALNNLFFFAIGPFHLLFLPDIRIEFQGVSKAESLFDIAYSMKNNTCCQKVPITYSAEVYKRTKIRDRRPYHSSTYSSGTFFFYYSQ